MNDKINVIARKQLRGDIITRLHENYSQTPYRVSTLVNAFTGKTPMSAETEVPNALCYLADEQKAFVRITYGEDNEPALTPMRNAYVQLTATGVNLAEGDIDDPGVILGDGQRY